MGEISDMMRTGVLCVGCGGFVQKKELGYPVYCSEDCREWHGLDYPVYKKNKKKKVKS